MKKKHDAKKIKKPEKKSEAVVLTPEETSELQMVLDRLAVQDPEGGSLENYLKSLRQALGGTRAHDGGPARNAQQGALTGRLPRFHESSRTPPPANIPGSSSRPPYRFSQRGYAARQETPAAEKVVLIQREVREPIAHTSRMDSGLWLISAILPEGETPSPRAVVAYAEDSFRSVRAVVNESSYKSYREYVAGVVAHLPEKKMCEIPVRHMAKLFHEMLDYHGEDSQPGIEQTRRLLAPYYDPRQKPYVFELMPDIEHAERHLAALVPETVTEGVDISWLFFSKDDIASYKQKLDELDNPVLVVPPEVQKERSFELIRKASEELCSGKVRERFRRFLEEQAMWGKLAGRENLATIAWIAARHLAGDGKAGENPFVLGVVVESIRREYPQEFKDAEQAQERSEEGPYHRMESGLIVP